jgi:hypothetical protein
VARFYLAPSFLFKTIHMKRQYWINVKHVDNRLVIFLNGEIVWDSGIVHGDPGMNHFVDITEYLQAHPEHTSELIFEGFNDSYTENDVDGKFNPWHFNYRVFKREVNDKGEVVLEKDILAPYNEKHLSDPNTKAIENTYQIILRDNEYKVISNNLSQHFYQ